MGNRKKRSPIWFIPKQKLVTIVSQSNSFSKILSYFNLKNKGGNFKTLKNRCEFDGIDLSHIKLGQNSNKGKKFPFREKKKMEEILITNSSFDRGHLKERLIKEGILENKCSKCGLLPEWDKQVLVMIMDHKNGVGNDHRLENLRLLCPNCNSQTPTFAGRNFRKAKKIYLCKGCGNSVGLKYDCCVQCASKNRRKAERPSKEVLIKQIEELGYCGTGRLYNVSDKAIRKWVGLKK